MKNLMNTLVHEMVHAWQEDNGKPTRGGYHNKEWAAKALDVGLEPKVYDKSGKLIPDRITGQRVDTVTIPDGPFEKALIEMPEDTMLPWLANELYLDEEKEKKTAGNRSKYTCPGCGTNAWAKPGCKLICGECHMDMVETVTKKKKTKEAA